MNAGEEVRFESRPHGVALVRPLARTLLLAGAGALVLVLGSGYGFLLAAAGAGALALAALLAFGDVLRWDRTEVVLTTDKLFVVRGIARRRAAAVHLARIGAVEVEQGLLGRILGYGTLVAGSLEIPYVPDPRSVCRLMV
jgi:uncharacterized membrane protein YdbT with pleckstrin-like domain